MSYISMLLQNFFILVSWGIVSIMSDAGKTKQPIGSAIPFLESKVSFKSKYLKTEKNSLKQNL